MVEPRWDVFLSYSRREDAGPAIAIGDALRASGLRVFWDDAEVPAFQAISPTIMGELAHAKVLLTYYNTVSFFLLYASTSDWTPDDRDAGLNDFVQNCALRSGWPCSPDV